MHKLIKPSSVVLLVGTSFLLSACTYMTQGFFAPGDRGAKPAEADFFGDSINSIVYLDQNWDAADSLWFYNTTQGSDLIDYDIFLHLEQADSQELFRSDENMQRYRYLVQNPTWDNPDGLPVGFVKDAYRGTDYIGFTCAACHTGQVNYQGVGIRIDGGPAMADMENFLIAMEAALKNTSDDPAKLERLAKNIYGDDYQSNLAELKAKITKAYEGKRSYNYVNAPVHGDKTVHYGYARLDAFGRIYNRILTHLTPEDESNFNPASAPVSYPFLWDTPQHDFVQWNGVSENAKTGALGRNVGEVMGVFGTMELHTLTKDNGYRSSVDVRNIVRLERHLGKLESPEWPDVMPAIDEDLAARGRQVYTDYRCNDCHNPIDRSDHKRLIKAQMASLPFIRTDPQMVMNAVKYEGESGYFEGHPVDFEKPDGPKFEEKSIVLPLLNEAGRGVVTQPDLDKPAIYRGLLRLYDITVSIWDNPVKPGERSVNFEPNSNMAEYLIAYKGRPLNGIWATAPYLHNGSVQNLYELFLPQCTEEQLSNGGKPGEDCRSITFTVGSREFDPVKVGFVSKPAEQYPDVFVFDTRLPSNTNAGHEYAAGKTPMIKLDASGKPLRNADNSYQTEYFPPMNDDDRWALVEYLKTL